MLVQPVLVFAGSAEQLRAAYARAVAHQVRLGIFTEELFATDDDADNRGGGPLRCPAGGRGSVWSGRGWMLFEMSKSASVLRPPDDRCPPAHAGGADR
jgi:uncharacterized protein DUF2000